MEVTRTVDTDLTTDKLWALVSDCAAWCEWMVDAADVLVEPGGEGTVEDGGMQRSVRIDDVGDGRLTFTWWPVDDDRRASTVELVVLPNGPRSTLHITERCVASASATDLGMAWDIRTLLLVLRAALVTA